jgi:hypothetical protein
MKAGIDETIHLLILELQHLHSALHPKALAPPHFIGVYLQKTLAIIL